MQHKSFECFHLLDCNLSLWLKHVALQNKSPGYKISAFHKASVMATLVPVQPFLLIHLQFTYLRLSPDDKIRWRLPWEPHIFTVHRRPQRMLIPLWAGNWLIDIAKRRDKSNLFLITLRRKTDRTLWRQEASGLNYGIPVNITSEGQIDAMCLLMWHPEQNVSSVRRLHTKNA